MQISEDLLSQFPSLPDTIYESYPIYLEPVAGSGERITILIAIVSPNIVIHKVIRAETLESMFGSKAASFAGLVSMCADSLEAHLQKGGAFNAWDPPLSGCYKGNKISEYARDTTDTLRLSTRIYSSMGFIPGEAEFNDEPVTTRRDRWPDLIEAALFDKQPGLVKNMHADFRVSDNARPTTIDFVGQKYAANFGKVDPGQNFTNGIRAAKAKLWDLEALREARHGIIEDRIVSFELLLWRPDFDSPAYSERQISSLREVLAELEHEGDKRELRVFQTLNQGIAADRIILKEAA